MADIERFGTFRRAAQIERARFGWPVAERIAGARADVPRPNMLWTLQWYVFRELGKSFLLTAIGLTAILGMGGGVLNMIGMQQITAGQLFRLMSIVFPVAGTLSLPVAAMFSAAVTYGRFSADNELVACRASGVDIHRLLAPTVVISLVAAVATFSSINYVIPQRFRNLDEFVRSDVSQIVQQQLQAPGRLPLAGDRYRIYAERAEATEDPELPTDSEELLLNRVAFVEMDQGNWVRYGTAEAVRIRFDELDSEPLVRADFYGLAVYDADRKNPGWIAGNQSGEASRIRRSFRLKIKWLDLSELLYYRTRVEELASVGDEVKKLRAVLVRERLYRSLWEDFREPNARNEADCELTLADDRGRLILQADALIPDAHDYKPTFENVSVVQMLPEVQIRARAGGGTVEVDRRTGDVYVKLTNGVEMDRVVDGRERRVPPRNSYTLQPVRMPQQVIASVDDIPAAALLDLDAVSDAGPGFRAWQAQALLRRDEYARDIIAEVHSRLAFSFSPFILVILAAALGVVLRGSHLLTAFGISFIPSLLVIVAIITGRQLAQNESTLMIGVVTIWAGIAVVLGLDLWVLTRVLRR